MKIPWDRGQTPSQLVQLKNYSMYPRPSIIYKQVFTLL